MLAPPATPPCQLQGLGEVVAEAFHPVFPTKGEKKTQKTKRKITGIFKYHYMRQYFVGISKDFSRISMGFSWGLRIWIENARPWRFLRCTPPLTKPPVWRHPVEMSKMMPAMTYVIGLDKSEHLHRKPPGFSQNVGSRVSSFWDDPQREARTSSHWVARKMNGEYILIY